MTERSIPAKHQLLFLGTGAAQGIPAAYSPQMRSPPTDSRNIRSRSSVLIDDSYQIDAGPDSWYQLLREQKSWDSLEHLMITHTHSDHLYWENVLQKSGARDHKGGPLNIYLSEVAKKWFLHTLFFSKNLKAPLEEEIHDLEYELSPAYHFHQLTLWQEIQIGEFRVTPVLGNHTGRMPEDHAHNLLLKDSSGTQILYAVDTGFYSEESFEFLHGNKIDVLIMDCTFGARTDRAEYPAGHLDCKSFIRMVARLEKNGTLRGDTRIIATHINPDQGWDHEEMDAFWKTTDYNVITAWDGLTVGFL